MVLLSRWRSRLLMLFSVALVGAGGVVAPAAKADTLPTDECKPFVMLVARGSGQDRYKDTQYPDDFRTYSLGADGALTTNEPGWEGETMYEMLYNLHWRSEKDHGESVLKYVDILALDEEYRADKVDFGNFWDKNPFALGTAARAQLTSTFASSNTGKLRATETLEAYQKDRVDRNNCPPAEVLLAGYSQGAMSLIPLEETIINSGANSFGGAFYLGNPYMQNAQSADENVRFIGGGTGPGIYHKHDLSRVAGLNDAAALQPGRPRVEYCLYGDMMCDDSAVNAVAEGVNAWKEKEVFNTPHHNYYVQGKNVERHNEAVAQEFNNLIFSKVYPTGDLPAYEIVPMPTDTQARQPLETMFVIDTTGSMSDDINAVINRVEDVAKKLLSNPASRVGIIEYRGPGELSDQPNREPAVIRQPLTHDIDSFKQTLQSIRNTGGGREYVYTAAALALSDAVDWSEDINRSIILIGDEPGDDGHLATQFQELMDRRCIIPHANALRGDFTVEENRCAVSNLPSQVSLFARMESAPLDSDTDPQDLGPMAIHVLTNDNRTAQALRPLAENNHGQVFTYTDDDIAESLNEALDAIADQPVAALVSPNLIIAGEEAEFLTGLSMVYTEGPAQMTVTTSDGQTITPTDGVASIVFTAAGEHEVTLTVEDAQGRSDSYSVVVNVLSEEEVEAAVQDIAAEYEEILRFMEEPQAPGEPGASSSLGRMSTGSSLGGTR